MGSSLSLYLADACALIGFYRAAPAFPPALRSLIEESTASIAVVATTVWEVAIKIRLGKLVEVREPRFATLGEMLQAQGFALLAFDHATAERAASLPPLHNDPFDRALVAAAQRAGRTILTSDRIIARYGVPVRW
jgi:PIN domain nuclease of toxin-antitoxin system